MVLPDSSSKSTRPEGVGQPLVAPRLQHVRHCVNRVDIESCAVETPGASKSCLVRLRSSDDERHGGGLLSVPEGDPPLLPVIEGDVAGAKAVAVGTSVHVAAL